MAQPTTTDLTRLVDEGPATPSLPQYQKLLLAAVVLMPLQRAFTVDVGFPFKPTEVLIFLAAASCVMARVRIGPTRLVERLAVVLLGLVGVSFTLRWPRLAHSSRMFARLSRQATASSHGSCSTTAGLIR